MRNIGFVVALLAIVVGCESNQPVASGAWLTDTTGLLPDERYTNMSMIYSDSAEAKMRVSGRVLERFTGDSLYTLFPEGIHVEFFGPNMIIDSEVHANWAIQYDNDEMMEARDSVVVINTKGEKLNTQHLIWNAADKSFYTDSFVSITTPDEVIFGDGLEANEDFTWYKIRNIKGTFLREDEES